MALHEIQQISIYLNMKKLEEKDIVIWNDFKDCFIKWILDDEEPIDEAEKAMINSFVEEIDSFIDNENMFLTFSVIEGFSIVSSYWNGYFEDDFDGTYIFKNEEEFPNLLEKIKECIDEARPSLNGIFNKVIGN